MRHVPCSLACRWPLAPGGETNATIAGVLIWPREGEVSVIAHQPRSGACFRPPPHLVPTAVTPPNRKARPTAVSAQCSPPASRGLPHSVSFCALRCLETLPLPASRTARVGCSLLTPKSQQQSRRSAAVRQCTTTRSAASSNTGLSSSVHPVWFPQLQATLKFMFGTSFVPSRQAPPPSSHITNPQTCPLSAARYAVRDMLHAIVTCAVATRLCSTACLEIHRWLKHGNPRTEWASLPRAALMPPCFGLPTRVSLVLCPPVHRSPPPWRILSRRRLLIFGFPT